MPKNNLPLPAAAVNRKPARKGRQLPAPDKRPYHPSRHPPTVMPRPLSTVIPAVPLTVLPAVPHRHSRVSGNPTVLPYNAAILASHRGVPAYAGMTVEMRGNDGRGAGMTARSLSATAHSRPPQPKPLRRQRLPAGRRRCVPRPAAPDPRRRTFRKSHESAHRSGWPR